MNLGGLLRDDRLAGVHMVLHLNFAGTTYYTLEPKSL